MQTIIESTAVKTTVHKPPLEIGGGEAGKLEILPIRDRKRLIKELRKAYIRHPKANHITRALDKLYHYGNLGEVTGSPARTLLITGPSGGGKTRLMKRWASQFQSVEGDDETTMPVLFVDIAANSTPRGLIEHCLMLLGAPVQVGSRDSVAVLTARLIHYIRERKVQIIIFDELQHVEHGGRKKASIVTADFFKSILNASICPIVLAGIEEAAEIFDGNIQLRRRSNGRLTLPRFDWRQEKDRMVFRSLLGEFERKLPFTEPSNLAEMGTALRVSYVSEGLFGRAVDFLIEATEYALDTGATALTRDVLAETFDEMGEESDTWINPFRVEDGQVEERATVQAAKNASRVTRLHRRTRGVKPTDVTEA